MSTPKPSLVALRDERAATIKLLTEAFASDLIDVDEFESRVDQAHRAQSVEALISLRQDLEPAGASPPASALATVDPEHSRALAESQPRARWVVSVMGGAERKGQWRVPHKLRAVALMGGVELDFREALLAPGVSEVKVMACMGGVEIIVPPDLAVECNGVAIMGGFESLDRFPVVPDPERPLLRITGAALMGGVEISTRLPGESARQARKRRKREHRARARALEGRQPPRELSE